MTVEIQEPEAQVAESLALARDFVVELDGVLAARDGAEAVRVEYEVRPAVTDAMAALAKDAPALWPGAPDNVALDQEIGPLIHEPLKGKRYRVDPGVRTFRCKFMTAPGCQFAVRTAALKKIEAALVEAGISFAGAGPQTILVRRAPDP